MLYRLRFNQLLISIYYKLLIASQQPPADHIKSHTSAKLPPSSPFSFVLKPVSHQIRFITSKLIYPIIVTIIACWTYVNNKCAQVV